MIRLAYSRPPRREPEIRVGQIWYQVDLKRYILVLGAGDGSLVKIQECGENGRVQGRVSTVMRERFGGYRLVGRIEL